MTPWLLFGAGGTGVGSLIARHALTQGREVVALVRNSTAAQQLTAVGAKVVCGDATDSDAVMRACQLAGTHATIISTMGGGQDYLSHRAVIDCAEAVGLRRMVLVTSLGCGDSWAFLSDRAKAAFGHSVREKSLAECWLASSQLDFAILRPGGLLNGSATGLALRQQNQEVHGFVMREDVAAHAAELAAQDCLGHQIYSLIQPGLAPKARTSSPA